jgi:tetratricopeptide (TPR) repeat protein
LAWSGLGILQAISLGQFEAARVSFTKAAELAPSEAQYQNSLGNLEYDRFHNTELAEKHFQKALELNPTDDSARHNYAFMLRDTLGRTEEAKNQIASLAQPDTWKDTQALHSALFAAYEQNWGQVIDALKSALGELKNSTFPSNTHDDWCRASAVLIKLGLGPKLLEFLKSEGVHETMMPWFAALEAHTVGDRQMLLNIPAEAQDAAGILFDEIEKRLPLVRAK